MTPIFEWRKGSRYRKPLLIAVGFVMLSFFPVLFVIDCVSAGARALCWSLREAWDELKTSVLEQAVSDLRLFLVVVKAWGLVYDETPESAAMAQMDAYACKLWGRE